MADSGCNIPEVIAKLFSIYLVRVQPVRALLMHLIIIFTGDTNSADGIMIGLGIDFGSKLDIPVRMLCYLYDILALTSQVEGVKGVYLSWDEADLFGFAGLAGHDWPPTGSL
jgi:hypothetical protein